MIEVPRAVARRTAAALRAGSSGRTPSAAGGRRLERELAPADVYHACGSLDDRAGPGRPRRDRRAGRRSIVIYDAIDNVFEGNSVLGMPAPIRAVHRARERRWARSADARTTVNEALAARLRESWGIAEPPLVLPNYPERIAATRTRRRRTSSARRSGFRRRPGSWSSRAGSGRTSGSTRPPRRSCASPTRSSWCIGFGRWEERASPARRGSAVRGPPLHAAGRSIRTSSSSGRRPRTSRSCPLPPVSANQRPSTPNKFWEAIAAGTPVVVAPGLEVMARLVTEHGLGVVARSLAPDDLAGAIRSLLDRPADERAAERRRIRTVAAERFSWPVVAAAYRALVRDRLGQAGVAPPGG